MKYINELETWNKTVPSRGVNTHSKLFQLFFFKLDFTCAIGMVIAVTTASVCKQFNKKKKERIEPL